NALPAWQGGLGMQRLIRAAGRRLAVRSDRQAVGGLEVVRTLAEAGADNLRAPFARKLLERLADAEPGYLAHEFMNENWAPCFHADVAAAFAEAKFTFVGSARLHENFPDLMLNEGARKVAARFDDPVLFELIKDTIAGSALRQDVYVRGLRRLTEAERNAALGEVALVLTQRASGFRYEFEMPAGKASLNRNFYGPVVEALASGPRLVRELLELPGRDHERVNAPELAAMLVGSGQAMVTLRPTATPERRLDQFHAAAARRLSRASRLDHPVALASSRLGAGLVVPVLELLVLSRLVTEGPAEPLCWARMLAPALDAEKQEALAQSIARILEERAQIWRLVGLI
ncbi:MAG: methyltransferase regulatory domain-containing protein, partial [Acetobacteraceae bacterium]